MWSKDGWNTEMNEDPHSNREGEEYVMAVNKHPILMVVRTVTSLITAL